MALEKYPNRRIYDTDQRRYIAVENLRERLLNGETVTEKRTRLDVTGEALANLLVKDLRAGGGPTPEALRALIEAYMKLRADMKKGS